MKKCSNCHTQVEIIRSAVKNGIFINNLCDKCLSLVSGSSLYNRKYDRDRQREDYRKDLIQNWEPEFAKEFPQEALDAGWSEEDMRLHG